MSARRLAGKSVSVGNSNAAHAYLNVDSAGCFDGLRLGFFFSSTGKEERGSNAMLVPFGNDHCPNRPTAERFL